MWVLKFTGVSDAKSTCANQIVRWLQIPQAGDVANHDVKNIANITVTIIYAVPWLHAIPLMVDHTSNFLRQ